MGLLHGGLGGGHQVLHVDLEAHGNLLGPVRLQRAEDAVHGVQALLDPRLDRGGVELPLDLGPGAGRRGGEPEHGGSDDRLRATPFRGSCWPGPVHDEPQRYPETAPRASRTSVAAHHQGSR
ncbi:MAG: hypothetical protein FJ221_08190 [Lentisphaerae bacterium]|nr:hypothetical protein [Lentisphaerota bacterium]